MDVRVLDPLLSADQVNETCSLARQLGVRGVVVRACDVELVQQWTRGSGLLVSGAAGYPDGTGTTGAKLFEGRDLLRQGTKEIEFTLNPARLIARGFQAVEAELMQITKSCHEAGAKITVVCPQSSRLADDLKIIAIKICRRVEVDVFGVDGTDAELALLNPLLKDMIRLKRMKPVTTLEEALAAKTVGFASFNADDPASVLEEWRRVIAAQAEPPSAS